MEISEEVRRLLAQSFTAPDDLPLQGADDAALQRKRIGTPVPTALADWLRITNGATVGPGGLFGIATHRTSLDIESCMMIRRSCTSLACRIRGMLEMFRRRYDSRDLGRTYSSRNLIETIRALPGAHLCKPAPPHALATLHALPLPDDHLEFLTFVNGASAFHGYFRLFGSGCAACVDLDWWNNTETWKFAWPESVNDYVLFGETGWGDQFAYDRQRLNAGDTTVYLLDSFEMQPEVLAAGFSEFMTNEFMRNAREPYDSMTKAARTQIGPLAWNEHVTYIPSLLLGGDEDVDHIQKLDARTSMIINGDIATQSLADPDKFPASVVPYTDDRGRPRMRIVWA